MHTKPSHHVLFMSSFESFPSSPLLPSSSSPQTLSCSSPSSSSPSPTPSPTPPPSPPPVSSTPSSATSPLHSYHSPHPPKTGHLPTASLSAIAARFCSCSLRRNGASILEYSVGPGNAVEPYADRLVIVRQCLDASLSPSAFYPAPGYRLLSPVFGLLFYNPDGSQLRIASITRDISIDFSESAGNSPAGKAPGCAFWDLAGNVRL